MKYCRVSNTWSQLPCSHYHVLVFGYRMFFILLALLFCVQSIMSSSTRSSIKRTRGVSWAEVLCSPHLRDITVDKDELDELLQKTGDVSKFLDQTPKMQEVICNHVGITGWKDHLISAIKDVVRLNRRRARILSLVYLTLFLATSAGIVTISI